MTKERSYDWLNLSHDDVAAMLRLAGIELTGKLYELVNQYNPAQSAVRPWWLAITSHGPITLGPRKRVLEIDWSGTPLMCTITEDDTTNDVTRVHAWSRIDAVRYLTELAKRLAELDERASEVLTVP